MYRNHNWTPIYVVGSTAAYLTMRNWSELELGRVFNEREIVSSSKVCLIGQTLVRQLFGNRYPIGEEIRIRNVPFTVIGVLSEKGAGFLGTIRTTSSLRLDHHQVPAQWRRRSGAAVQGIGTCAARPDPGGAAARQLPLVAATKPSNR